MKKLSTSIPLTAMVLSMAFAIDVSAADNRNGFDEELNARAQRSTFQESSVNNLAPQSQITRRQASAIASDRFEGRVLGIMMDNSNNTYRVRMDRDGTVFNVFINANSGDVSGTSE